MCVIAAKYFKDKGWVLAKNRDQDYVSHVSFRDKPDPKVGETLVMYDHDIDYQEGMNHAGLVIITTSLTPEIVEETNKEDGTKICNALHMTQEEAVKYLTDEQMTGFIFVGTPQKLVVIEAAKEDNGKGAYKSVVRVIPKTETIVRTNHGIRLPWAGFQYGVDKTQDLWRKSSESRKRIAQRTVEGAKSPEEMLDALAEKVDNDLQMNVFRVESRPKQMRTIFQWALVPSEGIAIIRPVQTKLNLKVTPNKLDVQVLDNEILKTRYNGRIKHFSRIEVENGGKEIKTVVKENFKTFKEYTGI